MFFITALLLCVCSSAFAQKGKDTQPPATTQQPATTAPLRLYPNPAKTYTNIYVELPTVQSFTISIYDLQFKANLTDIPVNSRKSYQYALDVSKLPTGQYRITVKGANTNLEEILTVNNK